MQSTAFAHVHNETCHCVAGLLQDVAKLLAKSKEHNSVSDMAKTLCSNIAIEKAKAEELFVSQMQCLSLMILAKVSLPIIFVGRVLRL